MGTHCIVHIQGMVITGHMKLFALNNVLEQLAGVNMLHVPYHGSARSLSSATASPPGPDDQGRPRRHPCGYARGARIAIASHFEQIRRIGEARYLQRGGRWQCSLVWEVGRPPLAENVGVRLDVGKVA